MDYQKVIFVTETDTSRGPLAAAILQKQLGITKVVSESRGLVVLFQEPMNAKTVAIAASKGLDLSKYASIQLSEEDFGRDVLVLVLNETNKQKIYDAFKEAVNVYSLQEFINEPGKISDPYGGELADYGKMYEDMEQVLRKLVVKLKYNK